MKYRLLWCKTLEINISISFVNFTDLNLYPTKTCVNEDIMKVFGNWYENLGSIWRPQSLQSGRIGSILVFHFFSNLLLNWFSELNWIKSVMTKLKIGDCFRHNWNRMVCGYFWQCLSYMFYEPVFNSNQSFGECFFLIIRDISPFCVATDTSVLVMSSLGFKSRVGSLILTFKKVYVLHITWDSSLVRHLPTSW